MTGNRRTRLGEIDTKRDPISLDLDYGEVVHIPGNPISTEIVRTREGLDEIGTGLLPRNRGNVETVHILGKSSEGLTLPGRKVTSECCHGRHESRSTKSNSVPVFERNQAS